MAEQNVTSKINIVEQMRKTYVENNVDVFKSFFTEDVLYKPGAIAETRGQQALFDYLRELYAPVIINKMSPRGIWEVDNVVIYDYDMELTYISTNKTVTFPCVDIFEFSGNRISQWRVYPLHPSFITIKL
jgi:limonene-1,2-epoxide hydrolase